MQMGRLSQARLVADRALNFVRLPPLTHAVIPALRITQGPINRGDVLGDYWAGHVHPEAFSVRMVDGRECGLAVEEAVGFGDRFLDGEGVHVDAEGGTFTAPPELEFEDVHVDDLLSF
jgi:hypothetical protein